jgi:hypothetical protein
MLGGSGPWFGRLVMRETPLFRGLDCLRSLVLTDARHCGCGRENAEMLSVINFTVLVRISGNISCVSASLTLPVLLFLKFRPKHHASASPVKL